jgi:hypothetical protein
MGNMVDGCQNPLRVKIASYFRIRRALGRQDYREYPVHTRNDAIREDIRTAYAYPTDPREE